MRKHWPYLAPHFRGLWPSLIAGLCLLVVRVVLDLLAPWPLKVVFDSVLGNHRFKALGPFVIPHAAALSRPTLLNLAILTLASLAVWTAVASYGGSRLMTTAAQQALFRLRAALFAHVIGLPLQFHGEARTGDIMARLSGDVQAVQSMATSGLTTVITAVLSIVGMVVIMFIVDWRYALLVVLILPPLAVGIRWYMGAMRRTQRIARREEGGTSALMQEVLVALKLVHIFDRQDSEHRRFTEQSGRSLSASLSASNLQAQFTPMVASMVTLGGAALLWYGANQVLAGKLTPGEVLVFMAYVRGMYSPVRMLVKQASSIGRGMASAERLIALFDAQLQLPRATSPRTLRRAVGAIRFDHVSLSYDGAQQALTDVCLSVAPGQVVALVGSTGAGKSSLTGLLCRLYDPQAGAVLLDDVDVRQYRLSDLRRQIAYVPQESYLFHGTVWSNIAYGHADATRLTAIEAAHELGVARLLLHLPQGFDTMVGERGATLSGGQRQCIALARAFVRDAPIVILDEPTTGLDAASEALVVAALHRLLAGRTAIIVAHHLSTIEGADVIVVMEQGAIIEQGAPAQLMTQRAAYHHLWSVQTGARAG